MDGETLYDTMSAEPIISPEIVDSIIEQLSEDKKALLKCSSVCKAWVPPCRYHRLFSQQLSVLGPEHWYFLHNSDILHVYARALKLTCYHPPRDSDPLEEILHPLLGFFLIKLPRLLVRRLLPNARISEHQFNAELVQLTFPCVAILVVELRFSLNPGWWHDPGNPHDPLLKNLAVIFPHVMNLDLVDTFSTFRGTIQFIRSFPELETLTIFFRGWARWSDIENVGHFRFPVGLKTIRCGGRQWEVMHFVEWLSVMESTPRLIALTPPPTIHSQNDNSSTRMSFPKPTPHSDTSTYDF